MNLEPINITTLPNGTVYDVPKERAIIQVSTYSMEKDGQIGIKQYLKQFGKQIWNTATIDDVVPDGQFKNNNHPAAGSIVVSSGENIEFGLENLSKKGLSIAFGIGKIQNPKGINNAYVFYEFGGLKSTPFYKQVDPNQSHYFTVPIEQKTDYENYPEYQSGTLHKLFAANLIVNGQIYTEEIEYSYGGNDYYGYDGIKIKANGTTNIKLHRKSDRSKYVALKIETYGFGNTGRVTILEQNGCGISANHILISPYNFNYAYEENGKTIFQQKENFITQFFKQFNNEGYINEETMSIEQAVNTKTVAGSTTATVKEAIKNYKYYLIGVIAAIAIFILFKTKKIKL